MINRRDILRQIGTVSVAGGLAGCAGDSSSTPGRVDDCTISNSLGDVSSVQVSVDGEQPEAAAVLDLRWNARAQPSMKESPDAPIGYESESDEKYIVFRLKVTNTADEVVTVDRFNFKMHYQTPNVVDTIGSTITGMEDIDVSVRPDGAASGILPFTVPNTTTTATLQTATANFPDRVPVAFDPSCNDSLRITTPLL